MSANKTDSFKQVELQDQDAGSVFWKTPLLFVGAIGTGYVLSKGLVSMLNGEAGNSQKMMRGRVMFQGATVATLLCYATYRQVADRF
jgi:hypothetical protein